MYHLMIESSSTRREYIELINNLIESGCISGAKRELKDLETAVLMCGEHTIVNIMLYKGVELYVDIYSFTRGYEYYYEKIVEFLKPYSLGIHFIERKA